MAQSVTSPGNPGRVATLVVTVVSLMVMMSVSIVELVSSCLALLSLRLMYQEARADIASENWQKSALFRKAIEPLQTRCVPEMHIKIKHKQQ